MTWCMMLITAVLQMLARVSPAELQQALGSLHALSESQWSIAKKSKDVTVWRRASQEFSGFLYKAEGSVAETPQRVMDHIRPGARRLHWDRMLTSLEILQTLDQGCCVVRYTTAGQLWNIISPREFVDFSCTSEYQRGLLSCGVSVEHDEQRAGLVRGFNHPCGWFCVPAQDSDLSVLTGYIQTELRGMLPQPAVDTAMASGLLHFYSDLRRALNT
ncbi:stAR-related lipid transfer protein 4 isoform X2 [Sinocyclocheilus grahami]|uniref:START domain-containing protein n=2 Tax=Sinocyclocheilus grahami TaxID=75366 RepID=A0A672KU64_SINGR|nr:PREDICTED: stAR-related lipid transfer protein 4 isoform X1 [Sinocyclocheilus grahami]XP_016117137.1 PREDICTED: stAR-related lipid transfer protein 4 isoform X2 [Sinocyclocheilus grahami]